MRKFKKIIYLSGFISFLIIGLLTVVIIIDTAYHIPINEEYYGFVDTQAQTLIFCLSIFAIVPFTGALLFYLAYSKMKGEYKFTIMINILKGICWKIQLKL